MGIIASQREAERQTHGQSHPCNDATAQPIYPVNDTKRTLSLVNFFLCVVTCVGVGWTIIPLIRMIPMTVRSWGIYKGAKPNTTAFGVRTLLFVNLIGGILLLVADNDRQERQNLPKETLGGTVFAILPSFLALKP